MTKDPREELFTDDPEARQEVCKLAYNESAKGLAIQESTLTSIRTAAAAMGTLAGLAATFLGKEVLTRTAAGNHGSTLVSAGAAAWVAVVALGVTLLLVIYLFMPRNNWIFHSSASKLLGEFTRPGAAVKLDVTYAAIAGFNEENYGKNAKVLSHLFVALNLLMAAVIAQVIAWLVALY